jgi:hypothetical protein
LLLIPTPLKTSDFEAGFRRGVQFLGGAENMHVLRRLKSFAAGRSATVNEPVISYFFASSGLDTCVFPHLS